MLDIKNLNKSIERIATEKDLDVNKIKEVVETALASAYKKESNRKGEIIRASLDSKSGKVKFFKVKIVVDKNEVRMPEEEKNEEEKGDKKKIEDKTEKKIETEKSDADTEEKLPIYNENRHIFIEEAKKIKKDAEIGDEISFDLPDSPEEFGRISAQTAKQVILQKIRDIEKEIIRGEFEDKVGEIVNGSVQRIDRGNIYIDLGKAFGMMYFSESIPGEHYRTGERLRFYLVDVQNAERNPVILLSRTHPKFISKLFELEVPEISDGIVEIKSIAREAGSRTKVAVMSNFERVDPVGACVGQRGSRIMAINSEFSNERIDIVEWSDKPEEYIASSLSPATVSSVEIISPNTALVLVPKDNISLAIGKGGQNVRLAAKLTGWKIDVRSQSDPEQELDGGISNSEISNLENENEAEQSTKQDEKPKNEKKSDVDEKQ